MTRVLQAIAGAEHGGAEAFFTRLVLALDRAGLEQRVVMRRHAGRAATLRSGGIEPVELSFGGALDFFTARGLRREIAAFRADVVLTWMSRASRLCPAGRFIHVGRLGGYYDLKYYRRCGHLIANTRAIVDYMVRSGWPAERAHHLPNFASAATAPPVPRKALTTPAEAPLLLALGRLHANKAFDVLIEALTKVPEAWLWLAGEGKLRGELEALAARLGVAPRIRFLGWREDVAGLLAAADMLICPSRHEPLGNVVIEAWAQGVPVIAAASAGPRELISPEENGLVVPIDDSGALAREIRRLLADRGLATRLVAGGRRTYEGEYSEATVVARYLDFFERVTGPCAA